MSTGQPVGTFTDLYEFTMAQSYLEHGLTGEAVFDLHVRELPPSRGFLVACGQQTLVDRLETFTFEDEDLVFLAEQGLSEELIDYLGAFSFEGRVRGVPEGRLVFPYEPLVEVQAPLPMAQLVETLVLNTVHVETVLASKAARCYQAIGAPEEPEHAASIVDFGARRAHGRDAAHAAARASYIAGFAGTSLVEAACKLEIPCFGTMAHAYVQAFGDEREALAGFARSFPEETTLLIDTYDTLEGARIVTELADELAGEGVQIGAVRIDSGDLASEAKRVRGVLDEAGCQAIDIFVSGGLDEHEIQRSLASGAPVDGFGVGTSMVVSDDAPALNLSYKLAAYEGEPVIKTSQDKRTLPGAKQVYRRWEDEEGGRMVGDRICLAHEHADGDAPGEPLLEPLAPKEVSKATTAARRRFLDEVQRIPEGLADLEQPASYPVERSAGIEDAIERALDRARGDEA